MKVSVVWIDDGDARLFHLSDEVMKRENIRRSGDPALFEEVAARLGTSERVLLLGPNGVKHRLREHLRERFPDIGRHVVGCETVERPSDGEIATLAMRYLRQPA